RLLSGEPALPRLGQSAGVSQHRAEARPNLPLHHHLPLFRQMNRSRLSTSILLGPLLATALMAESGLRYENPVYTENFPDPTVIRTGEGYVAIGTTGQGRMADGRIFTTITSPDLVNWKLSGGALVPPSDDAALQYWAPEICDQDGTYYLYYS